jgi:hypothetical protein
MHRLVKHSLPEYGEMPLLNQGNDLIPHVARLLGLSVPGPISDLTLKVTTNHATVIVDTWDAKSEGLLPSPSLLKPLHDPWGPKIHMNPAVRRQYEERTKATKTYRLKGKPGIEYGGLDGDNSWLACLGFMFGVDNYENLREMEVVLRRDTLPVIRTEFFIRVVGNWANVKPMFSVEP